jgi:hypothetical protein
MNKEQTIEALRIFFPHVVNDTCFWPPEHFNRNLHEKLSNKNPYKTPIITLYENYIPFQKRINKEIQDEWLTKESFSSIAELCYIILKVVSNQTKLELWQYQLIQIFKEYSH